MVSAIGRSQPRLLLREEHATGFVLEKGISRSLREPRLIPSSARICACVTKTGNCLDAAFPNGTFVLQSPEFHPTMSIFAGQQLRHLREGLGLTLRDVETASAEIAARHANQEFFIPFSRLSEIETKGLLPSIFRIYTLAAIYRCDYRTICAWYDVRLDA